LHQITHVGVSQSRGLKLFGREIIFEEFQPMWSWYLKVTDTQMDRWTIYDRNSALCTNVHRTIKTGQFEIPKTRPQKASLASKNYLYFSQF